MLTGGREARRCSHPHEAKGHAPTDDDVGSERAEVRGSVAPDSASRTYRARGPAGLEPATSRVPDRSPPRCTGHSAAELWGRDTGRWLCRGARVSRLPVTDTGPVSWHLLDGPCVLPPRPLPEASRPIADATGWPGPGVPGVPRGLVRFRTASTLAGLSPCGSVLPEPSTLIFQPVPRGPAAYVRGCQSRVLGWSVPPFSGVDQSRPSPPGVRATSSGSLGAARAWSRPTALNLRVPGSRRFPFVSGPATVAIPESGVGRRRVRLYARGPVLVNPWFPGAPPVADGPRVGVRRSRGGPPSEPCDGKITLPVGRSARGRARGTPLGARATPGRAGGRATRCAGAWRTRRDARGSASPDRGWSRSVRPACTLSDDWSMG